MTLLFREQHVGPILRGVKTQSRRLWDRWRVKVDGTYWASTHLYRKDARFARLHVTDRWEERLLDISRADARAEGYGSPIRFIESFLAINGIDGRRRPPNPTVKAFEWEVVR